MKINRIISGLLACAVMGGVLPYSSNVTENSAITVSAAEEYTVETYESLTYLKYSDHVEISGCDKSVTEVVIPSEIEGVPVTSIGEYAFHRCSGLTSIAIPDSVINIDNFAFDSCHGLTSITIPDSVTSIGEGAFSDCSSLTSITIPAGVKKIGVKTFSGCTVLTSITIPNSVTSIGDSAFSSCYGLTSITIPNSVTHIENNAFINCSGLTSIIIPDGVISIGDCTFLGCSCLTSITIPDSVTSIGLWAFNDTPWLESQRKISPLVIVNKILIDGETCEGEIVIPDSVKSIGDGAFHNCSGLISVEIPASVTSIGGSAFYGCEKLTSIKINNPECEIYNSKFTFTNNYNSGLTATIYGYKKSTAQAYAEKYGRKFESLNKASETTLSGDADLDGKVGISDVVKVMMYVANKEANPLSEQGLINADVYSSGDGVFISDALSIQKKVAQIIDTLPES